MVTRLPLEITRAPMRTVRGVDLADRYANPAKELGRLAKAGAVKKIAHGIYIAVPDTVDAGTWAPTLNEAGMAVATVLDGPRVPVLMGIGAARFHHAVPRAIGTTVVAVPNQRKRMELPMGEVVFVKRVVAGLDARLEDTELGQILVTTPEQTAFDLLMRPTLGTTPEEAYAAVNNLRPLIDPARFRDLLSRKRANAAVHALEADLPRIKR
jgi:predicted transcriptional regulator of viral defense system